MEKEEDSYAWIDCWRDEDVGDRTLVNADNLKWLDEFKELEAHKITYVDFDAFGCPNEQIVKFFLAYPIRRALIMSITDGMLLNFRTSRSADLEKYYLQKLYVGLGEQYTETDRYHITTLLGEYFFQLQKNFIDILCMRFGCQAHPLYWTVNPAKTVAYSAYLIMPKIIGVVDFKKYVGLKGVKQEDPKIL